jgi:hypothetical protein
LQRGHERIARYLTKASRSTTSAQSVPSVLAGPAAVQQRLKEKSEATATSMSVAHFLREADVAKYSPLFEEKAVNNMGKMVSLTDTDLKEMGVNLMGPRRKLTSAIAKQRKKMGLDEEREDI